MTAAPCGVLIASCDAGAHTCHQPAGHDGPHTCWCGRKDSDDG